MPSCPGPTRRLEGGDAMNAVERLLGHAEQVLRFFGKAYREPPDLGPLSAGFA